MFSRDKIKTSLASLRADLDSLKSDNPWWYIWSVPYLVVSESVSRHHLLSHWAAWQALRVEWTQLSRVRADFTTMSLKYYINNIWIELGIVCYLFLASFEHNGAGWWHQRAQDVPFWVGEWLLESCSRWYVKCWRIKGGSNQDSLLSPLQGQQSRLLHALQEVGSVFVFSQRREQQI